MKKLNAFWRSRLGIIITWTAYISLSSIAAGITVWLLVRMVRMLFLGFVE